MKKIETVYILVNTRTANAEVAYDDYDYAVEQFKQIGIDLGLHYDPCNRLYDDQFKLNYKLETVSIFPMPTKKEAV